MYIIAAQSLATNMYRVTNLLRVLSSILFIIVLLFVYANLPDTVDLTVDPIGSSWLVIPKSDFFYYSLIIFLLTNLIAFFFGRVFQGIGIDSETFFFSSQSFKDHFTTWWGIFPAIMNLIFMFSLGFIGVFNGQDKQLAQSYSYLSFLGQFLVAGWIIWLIVVLVKKTSKSQISS